MDDTQFYKTRMGQRFFEQTMPELVKQLGKLNELLQRLIAFHDRDGHNEGRPS